MEVGAEKMPPAAGRGRFLTLRGVGDAAPPYRGRLVVTFFYKPIDIVGFMCYHALTYKKDMLYVKGVILCRSMQITRPPRG